MKIPPGVRDGSRVRVAGEGGPGVGGGARGDLFLVIAVLPHPTFERKGDDVTAEIRFHSPPPCSGARCRSRR